MPHTFKRLWLIPSVWFVVISGGIATDAMAEEMVAENTVPPMPQTIEDSPFASEREAVIWRQDELKELERLLRQLRFDLVNNQDARGAAPRLVMLQERATQAHFLPAFIVGTHGRGSDARPEIWEEWEDFAEGFTDLEQKVETLVDAAEQEDYRAATQAFSDVGLSCKSCHRAYRYN
ncbi:cytochrome c [Halomonas qinghailakensis]|uniref:Cytochrome c n=2 Tax=Halomonas TaxID=2745 RepID=A0AA46TQN4_9GAMM|nr:MULTISPECIES: cytochrome c [Halomonas]UYO74428.1 cytochrome c [Halomonas sp. ZZQ-149]UYV20663.1 cytochrome c [Halomonas qaidamensis]